MTDSKQAKAALAALAAGDAADETVTPTTEQRAETDNGADYRRVIEQAVAATDDIEAAAAFVESVGVERLETAVETAEREVSELSSAGRDALGTFERFRAAAHSVDE